MQNHKSMIFLTAVLTIMTLFLTACGSGDNSTQTMEATSTVNTATTSVTSTSVDDTSIQTTSVTGTMTQITTATDDSFDWSSISEKAAAVSSVKYDMVVSMPDGSTTASTMWLTQSKMKYRSVAEGTEGIIIMDYDKGTMISYMPADNMAMKMTIDTDSDTDNMPASIFDYASEEPSAFVVGPETLDGKSCVVIEYGDLNVKVKVWYWQEKGIPLRIESTSPEGKLVTEIKNIDFSDIDDSEFELPVGVNVMDMSDLSGFSENMSDYFNVPEANSGE